MQARLKSLSSRLTSPENSLGTSSIQVLKSCLTSIQWCIFLCCLLKFENILIDCDSLFIPKWLGKVLKIRTPPNYTGMLQDSRVSKHHSTKIVQFLIDLYFKLIAHAKIWSDFWWKRLKCLCCPKGTSTSSYHFRPCERCACVCWSNYTTLIFCSLHLRPHYHYIKLSKHDWQTNVKNTCSAP